MSLLPLVMGQAFLPVLHNRDPFILIESPRGCLKTCTILDIIMLRGLQWPGRRWYIWRSSRELLNTTVLPSFEEYILPKWSTVRGMRCVNPGARPGNRRDYVFENGTVVIPVGLDDIQRGTSAEGAGGYLAEGIELDRLDQITALAGMMRQPGVDFHQIMVDANPGPPAHFLNQVAEPIPTALRTVNTREDYARLQEYNQRPATNPLRKWKRIVCKIQDNPHYFDVDKWELTDAGKKYMRSLGTLTGHLHTRWVLGMWKAAEGSVYPNFDDTVETGNVWRTFEIPHDWPLIFGTDPGVNHPWANLWFTISPNETLIQCGEIVVDGKGTDEIVPAVKAYEQKMGWQDREITRYGDPQYCFSMTAHSMTKETIAEQWAKLGLIMHRWPRTGDNMDGMVDAVRTRINAKTFVIMDCCPVTIGAVQSWSFKRNTDGSPAGAKGKDAYEELHKDPNDVIRGIVADGPKFEQSSKWAFA